MAQGSAFNGPLNPPFEGSANYDYSHNRDPNYNSHYNLPRPFPQSPVDEAYFEDPTAKAVSDTLFGCPKNTSSAEVARDPFPRRELDDGNQRAPKPFEEFDEYHSEPLPSSSMDADPKDYMHPRRLFHKDFREYRQQAPGEGKYSTQGHPGRHQIYPAQSMDKDPALAAFMPANETNSLIYKPKLSDGFDEKLPLSHRRFEFQKQGVSETGQKNRPQFDKTPFARLNTINKMAVDQNGTPEQGADARRARNPAEPQDPTHYKPLHAQASPYAEWPGALGKGGMYAPVGALQGVAPVSALPGASAPAAVPYATVPPPGVPLESQPEWGLDPYQRRQRMYAGPRYFQYPKYDTSSRYQSYYPVAKKFDESHAKYGEYRGAKPLAVVPPLQMGVPLLSAPLVKDTRRKERHRRGKSRTQKAMDASRSLEANNSSTTLIAPAFVPGMPTNSNHTGPPVTERPPGGFYWALLSRNSGDDDGYSFDENGGIITLPIQMCEPPLKNIVPAYPQALQGDPEPRTRKQSKYTAEQDKLILKLKDEGKSWAEIATEVNCHNQLAARNRYQVLIGQQGGGTFFWTADDCRAFQSLLDEGERAKWLFIAQELSKKCNRRFTIDMVHHKICELFSQRPERFNILKTRDPTRGGAPYKRKLL